MIADPPAKRAGVLAAPPSQTIADPPPATSSRSHEQPRLRSRKSTWVTAGVIAAASIAAGIAWTALSPPLQPLAFASPRGDAPPNLPVERLRRIELTERDGAFIVDPRVTLDPLGGFLVADSRELQVRRYDDDGDLIANFGRKGSGPGEFQHLSAVVRVNQDFLLVADMGGQLSVFDADGTFLHRAESSVAPLYDMATVGGSLVALTGRRRNDPNVLHLWNPRSERIVASFMPLPPHPSEYASAYAFAGTTDVAVRGDTLAATFALADTVYLFNLSGQLLEKVQIPFRHFRPLREPMPPSGSHLDAFRAWSESFSAISSIFWMADGSFLIEYFDLQGMEPRLSVAHVSRTGELLSEHNGSPRVLATDSEDTLVYFAESEMLSPNLWAVGRLFR
jgi:hypothetical protein